MREWLHALDQLHNIFGDPIQMIRMRGTGIILGVKLILWEKKNQINSVLMICLEMFGSGRPIGMTKAITTADH